MGSARWYQEATIYSVEVETFLDGNGDGIGDLRGLISRLDYLARLGVTALWLNPVHASPQRDDGYDVVDYYSVDERIGTLGEFVELVEEAGGRGIRILLDLVVNHTSNEHPWFQSARADPQSPFRDWYVWSDTRPDDVRQGIVFPHHQDATWTYDRTAGAWYYHRFYDFEPDLDYGNPDVREEVRRIAAFWLQLGVSGFRMDAAPFVIEMIEADHPARRDYDLLRDLADSVRWRRGDAVILAEANVPHDELLEFFGNGDRLPMLFNFTVNQRLLLALARRSAAPLVQAVRETPKLPEHAQWAMFLRNHDEADLSGLTAEERADVFAAFGPEPTMQLYDRGIRRRLAPMLDGDLRRLQLAYSLQFTLPGTPVLRYGEEIGMGDDLSLPERNAIRTPMQWSDSTNGGFSTAPKRALVRPVISDGPFGFKTVNVSAQQGDPDSLLSWMQRALQTLRECSEFASGNAHVVDLADAPTVFALVAEGDSGAMLAVHNLGDRPVTVDLGPQPEQRGQQPVVVFSDEQDRAAVDAELAGLRIAASGYRWIRLRSDAVPQR